MARSTGKLYDWCMEQGERGQRIIEEYVGDVIESEDITISDESWSEWTDISIDNPKEQIMNQYTAFSNIEVWWQCKDCKLYYRNMISTRVRLTYGCPKCSVKYRAMVHKENALKKGENDLLTWCKNNGVYGEMLMEEWMEEKNSVELGITMDSVNCGTYTRAYFKCRKCGYESMKIISSLTKQKSGCRKCSVTGTSYPEQFIYFSIKQMFEDTMSREKMFGGYEYDIVIPSKKVCVEYNGCYYHKWSSDRDKLKSDLCKENGYRLITIDDDSAYKNSDVVYEGDNIKFFYASKTGDEQIKEIIKYIVDILKMNYEYIDFGLVKYNTDNMMYKPLENSVLHQYPEIEKEFDTDINDGLDLRYFTYGSYKRVKWKCCKCSYIWSLEIYTRVNRKGSCPKCHYNIFSNEYVKKCTSKKVVDDLDRFKL